MRVLLPILALILWFFFAWRHVDQTKTSCCAGLTTEVENGKNEAANNNVGSATTGINNSANAIGPVLFNRSRSGAVTNERFPAFRDSIAATLRNGQILEISGEYRVGEENNSEFENLGLARAEDLKKLFLDKIPANRMRTAGKLVEGQIGSDPFRAVSFNFRVDNSAVKEIDNRALIYFSSGSDQKNTDRQIDAYFNDVAERLKNNQEKVRLTGHTDSDGSAESNQLLGLKRANAIKRILVSKGVNASRISVDSKGESQPVAPNDSEANKQKNRRTELEIIR